MTRQLTQQECEQIDQASNDSVWQDGKRRFWLCSPMIPALGCLFALGLKDQESFNAKNTAMSWAGVLFVHGVIPIVDIIVGEDTSNPPESALKALQEDNYYRWIVHAFIPLQYIALGVQAYQYTNRKLTWYNKLGLAVTAGIGSGIAINTAHELGHKSDKLNRTLARISLAPSAYGHFAIEHNFGHHRWVATPDDPASSRYNESFWQFLPRTVIKGLQSAIKIETSRLKRKNKGFWNINNELLQGWAMTAVVHTALYKAFGKKIIPFLFIQAVYGFSLLEVVNYLEHYGLKRQKNDKGRYVSVKPEHSWNNNNTVSNLFLYQLQRHSDHHAHPNRSYQLLRHFDDAPQLQSGYATMILPAYFPPLWFALMNNRVKDHYDGDISKVNMHPKPLSPTMQRATHIIRQGLDWLGGFKKTG